VVKSHKFGVGPTLAFIQLHFILLMDILKIVFFTTHDSARLFEVLALSGASASEEGRAALRLELQTILRVFCQVSST
jgi:hypothetical protein